MVVDLSEKNGTIKTKILFVSNVSLKDSTGQSAFVRNVYDEFSCYEDFSTRFVGTDMFPKSWASKNLVALALKVIVFQMILVFYFARIEKNEVCIFSFKPYMWSVLFLRIFRVRYVVLVEGLMPKTVEKLFPSWFRTPFHLLSKSVFKNAIGVICAYRSAADWVEKVSSGVRVEVVPCGFKELNFQASERAEYDLCYVGSFRVVHRLDVLLCFAKEYGLSVIFLGVGEQQSEIKERCQLMGIRSDFVGFVDATELPSYIGLAKVGWGVIDSEHWGVPMKVLDYVASGRPAITNSDHFSNLEVNGNVELVSSLDLSEIYRAFGRCLAGDIGFDSEELTDKYAWKNYCLVSQGFIAE